MDVTVQRETGVRRPLVAVGIGLAILVAACGGKSGTETSALPDVPEKPAPVEITFQGCPPDGDSGDHLLNRLKNRVDEGSYFPVPFDAVAKLSWPEGTERRDRANWRAGDAASVRRYEGIPLSIEGYLAGAREEGPESPNCHGAEPQFRDYHIWLTKGPGDGRDSAIVVETTPRVRANHPGWRVETLVNIAKEHRRVRVSGWLMLDQEHPEQIDKTRATLWEIHPITQVEVDVQGAWVPLDSFTGR